MYAIILKFIEINPQLNEKYKERLKCVCKVLCNMPD